MEIHEVIASLQQSIERAESELITLSEQRKQKRSELRRFRKAMRTLAEKTLAKRGEETSVA